MNSVENGSRNISIVNLEKIAKAFNLRLKDFLILKISANLQIYSVSTHNE
ncbi:hypothetical protein [Desulfosporosinus orientis]